MWIVKFGDNTRHSAWHSEQEARQQVLVLSYYGLIKLGRGCPLGHFVEYDETVVCENGHYYV